MAAIAPSLPNLPNKRVAFASIPEALAELQNGRAIVLVDSDRPDTTGDLLCAAEFVTPDLINVCTTQARGLISLAMTQERLDQLDIPLMVKDPSPGQAAFTVSIDAAPHIGGTTGISAADRWLTIQAAIAFLLWRATHFIPLYGCFSKLFG